MLLPRCMRHLLAMAMTKADEPGGSSDRLSVADSLHTDQMAPNAEQTTVTADGDWKSTVHALNVLRLVFVDATLASDVGSYVTEVRIVEECQHQQPGERQQCFKAEVFRAHVATFCQPK